MGIERVRVTFDNEVRLHLGPNQDSSHSDFSEETKFFICPLDEQKNIDDGWLALELLVGTKEGARFYMPIISGKEEELKKALQLIETHKYPTPGQSLNFIGLIEFSVADARVVGPSGLLPV